MLVCVVWNGAGVGADAGSIGPSGVFAGAGSMGPSGVGADAGSMSPWSMGPSGVGAVAGCGSMGPWFSGVLPWSMDVGAWCGAFAGAVASGAVSCGVGAAAGSCGVGTCVCSCCVDACSCSVGASASPPAARLKEKNSTLLPSDLKISNTLLPFFVYGVFICEKYTQGKWFRASWSFKVFSKNNMVSCELSRTA
jgi:hypothetical protein